MKRLLFSLSSVLIFGARMLAQQCSMVPVTLNDRVNNGSLVVEGKVIGKQSFWNPEHNYIFTSNLVEVYKVFKGATLSYQIEVLTEGGEVGLTRQVVEPSLQLDAGHTGIFVLNPSAQGAQFGKAVYRVYADLQGFVKYDPENGTARDPFTTYSSIDNGLFPSIEAIAGQKHVELQANSSASQRLNSSNSIAATISGFSPAAITAGTASSLTITGVGFGATQGTSYVEFPDADAGSGYIQPHASQYVSWNNTQIVVEVPTKTGGSGTAGTGQFRVVVAGSPTLSPSSLTINYGHLNVNYTNTVVAQQIFNTRHVSLNGLGGITWQMYTGFDAMAAPKASFQRAFQSWRCATLINWALGPPVATNTIALDGVDVIRFDIGAELPVGVLGRCTSYWNGCIVGTVINFFVAELDICFDDATNWQYGPAAPTGTQYDFESVTLHELGHGHQLSHVINTADVMHYSIANAQSKRVLNTDDINGGNAVMTRNLSGGVCGYSAMTALSPTACAAGTPTTAFSISPSATICAAQSVTLTDLSAGTPVSWSWTLTGGAPATSTVQNPVVSYATPGTYSITLVATNGFGSSTPLTKTISVLVVPVLTVTGNNSICSGTSATLTASGATSYTWNPGGLTGASQVLSPSSTTGYSVTGSNGACSTTNTFSVIVTATPTLAVTSATICSGKNATLTASGATNYTWNPGGLTGATQVLSPSSTTTYTVTGANGSCVSTKTAVITVNTTPTVTASSASPICAGQTLLLFSSSATTYTWSGPSSFSSNTQNPTISNATAGNAGTYTVTVTVGTCTNSATTSVTVNALPIPSASNTGPYCAGQTIQLNSGAATSYTWSGPGGYTSYIQNPTIANATTTMSGTYFVLVRNAAGCQASGTTAVVVNALPTATATSNSPVCANSTLMLMGGTGSTYAWFGPGGFTSTLQNPVITNVTLASSGTYTLVVTAATSCSAATTTTAGIIPAPAVSISASSTTLCTGQSATLTAGGASSYTFNPGSITSNPAVVSPTTTTSYTVTGTSSGCNGSDSVTISVSLCTGLETIAASGSIGIYPNPTRDNITVSFGSVNSAKVTVYSALGQELMSRQVREAESATIDLGAQAKGIYLISVRPEGRREQVFRVIKD